MTDMDGILEVEVRDKGRYYLHTRAVDFETLTRDQKWFQLARTDQLYSELQRPESRGLGDFYVGRDDGGFHVSQFNRLYAPHACRRWLFGRATGRPA